MSELNSALVLFRSIKLYFFPRTFEGALFNVEGAPITGATLYFGEVESTPTALSGKFVVNLKSGTYEVSVLYRGVKLEQADVVVVSGRTESLDPIKVSPDHFKELQATPETSGETLSAVAQPLQTSASAAQDSTSSSPLEPRALEEGSRSRSESLDPPFNPPTPVPELIPKADDPPQGDAPSFEVNEPSTITRFINAIQHYNTHEEELRGDFEDQYAPACQEMSDLIYQDLTRRGLKIRRLKRSKINQLFGFKRTLQVPSSQVIETLGVERVFVALIAAPHLWQLTPKGERLLEELILPEGSLERGARIDRRRGLFVFLAYRLPTRRSTGGYKGEEFQAALQAHAAELKSLSLGHTCLFNLGSRTHIGVIVHEAHYSTLQANPDHEYQLSLKQFERVYRLMYE